MCARNSERRFGSGSDWPPSEQAFLAPHQEKSCHPERSEGPAVWGLAHPFQIKSQIQRLPRPCPCVLCRDRARNLTWHPQLTEIKIPPCRKRRDRSGAPSRIKKRKGWANPPSCYVFFRAIGRVWAERSEVLIEINWAKE